MLKKFTSSKLILNEIYNTSTQNWFTAGLRPILAHIFGMYNFRIYTEIIIFKYKS
jgi:hypothetical protein